MSNSIAVKKAIVVVCGVSALAAGYFWFKKRRNRRKSARKSKSPLGNRQGTSRSFNKTSAPSTKKEDTQARKLSDDEELRVADNEFDYSCDLSSEENEEVDLKNRGRKNYRPHLKAKSKSAIQDRKDETVKLAAVENVQQEPNTETVKVSDSSKLTNGSFRQSAANQGDRLRWKDDVDRAGSTESSEPEIASAALNGGMMKSASGNRMSSGASLQNGIGHHHITRNQHAPSPAVSSVKSQCTDSPSLGSDVHSEVSQDSGKGGSTVVPSSMSPVEELIEVPPVYEFEVPRDIVGLLIGKKGTTIKWLTEQSQAYIVIRDHFYSEKHKICTLEGTREQINKCLRLIRRKFPPSRFPELRLTPIMPPPVSTTPRTPVWDNVVQLSLPEGVNCEVAVSSIVNIGHVFVQQPTHPTFSSLARLDQYMLAVYGQPAGVPSLPRPIEHGVICAAPVLGGWYRAQIIEIYDDADEALIKFVDYGGYCRVPASDLRQIRSDFMTLPFQATECYLANISPVDEAEGWSPDASTLFESLCLGKVIEAHVTGHSPDNIPMVELYSPTPENKPVLINRVLADRGYAAWTD